MYLCYVQRDHHQLPVSVHRDCRVRVCARSKGSVVLVIARSLARLEKMDTHIRGTDCIEMPELEESEAGANLLLYHAASANHVNEDVLRECLQRSCFFPGRGDGDVDDCHYLPLALKMFGQQLGEDADPWMVKLEELDTPYRSRAEEHPIFCILGKSFDALSTEDQVLFMDVALFYPRNSFDSSNDLSAWNISTLDWLHMVHGGRVEDIKRRLKSLKKKLLLESFDERGTQIGVHGLWREFAATEVNAGKQESSPWFYDDDEDYQIYCHGGLSLRGGGWENLQRVFISRRGKLKDELNLSLCSNLTVLTLRNVLLVNGSLDLSPLKCLKFLEIQFHKRPGSLQVLGLGSLGRLVVLRWFRVPATLPCLQEIGLLTNLQVLQLQFFPWKKNLTDFSGLYLHQMDFSRLSSLRTLSLRVEGNGFIPFPCHRDVRSLRTHVGEWRSYDAHRLGYPVNYGVYMLEGLRNFQKLQSLQKLDISRCDCIKALHGLDELTALLELKASGCAALEELPNLQKLQRLERLDISHCPSIRALPGLDELVVLLELDALGCCNLAGFPNLQKLQKLRRLNISVCPTIQALPGLDELVALLELQAGGCDSLQELPNLQKLQRLQILDISWCPLIKALPGLGDLVALQELRAKECFNLAELPDMRKLTSLRELNLKISRYYEGYRLKYPECFNAQENNDEHHSCIKGPLIKAVPGLDELIALSKLTVDFRVLEAVPDLRKLANLTKLCLRGWSSEAAPGVASLPNLHFLKVSYCEGLQLVEPTGMPTLTSLRRLKFYLCDFEDVSCLSSSPALQNLHVKYHDPPSLKKLLRSLLELPGVRFTLRVEAGDNRDWGAFWEEWEELQARSPNTTSA